MILFMLQTLQGFLELFPTLEIDVPNIQPVNDALNWLAWARAFIPVDLIADLLILTTLFYAFKVTTKLLKYLLPIILK